MRNRMLSSGLAIFSFVLGLGFAGAADAFEISCGRSRCAGRAHLDLQRATDLRLTGADTLQVRIAAGPGTTVLGDLVRPTANEPVCRNSNRQPLCLAQALASNPSTRNALRFRFTRPRTRPNPPTNAIPEPSAAFIFGVGLLVASALVVRTGEIE